MSAERLRAAAKLMRAFAEGATNTSPLPWFAVNGAIYAGTAVPHQMIAPRVTHYDDAVHIASWHPAVALAVADWLDAAAAENDSTGTLAFLNFAGADDLAALAVADAYMADSSPP